MSTGSSSQRCHGFDFRQLPAATGLFTFFYVWLITFMSIYFSHTHSSRLLPPQHLQWCSNINETTCDVNIPGPVQLFWCMWSIYWARVYRLCWLWYTDGKEHFCQHKLTKAKQHEGADLPTVQFSPPTVCIIGQQEAWTAMETLFSVWLVISLKPSWAVPLQCQCIVFSRELHPTW